MGTHRPTSVSWLVVVLLGVSALLAVPALSWAQEPVRNSKPQPLHLKVGDTVWVTDAPQLEVEKKTEAGINRSWDVLVGSIKTGKKVTVTLMSSTNVEGKFWAADRLSSHPSEYESGADIGAIVFGLPIGAIVGASLPIGPPLYEAAQVVGKTP